MNTLVEKIDSEISIMGHNINRLFHDKVLLIEKPKASLVFLIDVNIEDGIKKKMEGFFSLKF